MNLLYKSAVDCQAGFMAYKATDPLIRFWRKVQPSPDGCWLWTGLKTPNGYGNFFIKENPKIWVLPHRWIWERFNGTALKTMDIHHICEVKHCVNPAHLELVSRHDHFTRHPDHFIARQIAQNCCKNGHPFDRTGLLKGGRPYRWCSICKAASDRKRWEAYGRERRRERMHGS